MGHAIRLLHAAKGRRPTKSIAGGARTALEGTPAFAADRRSRPDRP